MCVCVFCVFVHAGHWTTRSQAHPPTRTTTTTTATATATTTTTSLAAEVPDQNLSAGVLLYCMVEALALNADLDQVRSCMHACACLCLCVSVSN